MNEARAGVNREGFTLPGWQGIVALLKGAVKRWQKADAARMAAALSYYAIFSLAPFLLIIISVASVLFERQVVRTEVLSAIQNLLGSDATGLVRTALDNVQPAQNRNLLASAIGVVTMLFGATALFSELQGVLNRIWGEDAQTNNGGILDFVRRRVLSFSMLLAAGALLVASLLATTILSFVEHTLPGLILSNSLFNLLPFANWIGSFLILTLFFAVLFRFLPDRQLSWSRIWIGAVVTGLLFTAGKLGIEAYLSHSALASRYGAAASLALLLLWIYYSAQILLFGAALTRELAETVTVGDHEAHGKPGAPGASSQEHA